MREVAGLYVPEPPQPIVVPQHAHACPLCGGPWEHADPECREGGAYACDDCYWKEQP